MGRRWLVAAILGLIVGGPLISPATAQEKLSDHQSEIELAAYADCVVEQRSYRPRVDAFLRLIPGSEGFYQAGVKAADMSCLDGAAMRRQASTLQMKLKPETYREALYPALYRREFGKDGPPASVATVAPLHLSSEFDGDVSTLPKDYAVLRVFGDCISRASPQGAHALLMARPYSRDSTKALELLKPILGSCIREGQTVTLTERLLRATIGEAMFKLSRAAAAAPVAASPAAQ